MRRYLFNFLAAGSLVVALCAPGLSRPVPAPSPPPGLKVGDAAPDFTLDYFDGHDLKKVSLHEYQGKKNVALAFYIFAFTGG
jgi:AhpC/TSA family